MMPMPPDNPSSHGRLEPGRWRPLFLAAGVVIIVVLATTWHADWWVGTDNVVFRYFNSQLGHAGTLQTLWAITNWRPFDTVAALIILVFVVVWLRAGNTEQKLAQFLVFCLLLLAAKACEHVISDLVQYRRQSPTLVYPDAVRLSELIDWVRVKDRGSTVFPGDHAFVIFATIGFFWLHASRKIAVGSTVILLPFTLPRIAVGAHWLTDVAVGGLSMALMLLCVAYATPLAHRLSAALRQHAARPLAGCAQLARKLRLLP